MKTKSIKRSHQVKVNLLSKGGKKQTKKNIDNMHIKLLYILNNIIAMEKDVTFKWLARTKDETKDINKTREKH